MKKIVNSLGIGIVVCVFVALALSAALFLPLILPFVDNTIVDINIKATREGLHGPYVHSNLRDRWEIIYAKAFGSEEAKKNFPPRKLKPLNPDLPPWVELTSEEIKIEMMKLAIKIGMPAIVAP